MGEREDLIKLKTMIYKSKNIYMATLNIKNKIDVQTFSRYFNDIFNFNKMKDSSVNKLIKYDLEDLIDDYTPIAYLENDIWKELSFITLVLNKYSKLIVNYIKLKEEYENSYLLSDFQNCIKIQNEINKECGISIWGVKNTINLLQETEGLEAQKEYCDELRGLNISTSLKVLIYLSSIGIETNTSYDYYTKRLDSFFKNSYDEKWYYYYMSLLKRDFTIKIENIPYILNKAINSSIIDLYEMYMKCLPFISVTEIKDQKNKESFIKILRKFYNNTQSHELVNYLRCFGVHIKLTSLEKNIENIEFYDYSLLNRFDIKCKKCEEILLKSPNYAFIYKDYIESIIKTGNNILFDKKTLIYNILINMKNIMEENEEFDTSIKNLLNIIISYPTLSILDYIISFIYSNLKDYLIPLKKASGQLNLFPNALKGLYWESESEKFFIKDLLELKNDSLYLNIINLIKYGNYNDLSSYIEEKIKIPEIRNIIMIMYYDFLEDYSKVLDLCNILKNSNDLMTLNFTNHKYLDSLIDYDLNKAIEVFSDYYTNKIYSDLLLPITKMCELVEKDIYENDKWPKSIDSVILFHAYFKERNQEKKGILEYLYEFYLVSNGYKTPMELISDYKKNNKLFDIKIIYFLKEICIPDILKKSIYIPNADLRERERINICHELIYIDNENKKNYLTEIKYREQEIFLKNEMNIIGKNKIHVNIEGIKEILLETLKDDFKRFKALYGSSNFDIENMSYYDSLKILYKNISVYNSETDQLESITKNIPSNEVYELLKNLVEIISFTFINDKHYGLNVYLSSRIRHGTLKNHLRRPVEEEHLVSLKSKVTGKYSINKYWEENISIEDEKIQEKIQESLETFSIKYDNLIDFISKNLLQINLKTNEKLIIENNSNKDVSDALFIYAFSENEMKNIMKSLETRGENELSLDIFIDGIIKIMWEKTDYNLSNIRLVLENEIKNNFIKYFNELIEDVDTITIESVKIKELKNSILRGKSEFVKTINNLTSWFNRVKSHDRNDYNITNAIELVSKSIPKINGKIKVSCVKNFMLKGETLESFVDIFYTLIDNCIKHNEMISIPDINISILIEASNIMINIENKVNTNESIDELNNKLNSIRELYGDSKSYKKISSEGETGFHKVWKFIKIDLLIDDHTTTFGYKKMEKDIVFFVDINMNAKDIIV